MELHGLDAVLSHTRGGEVTFGDVGAVARTSRRDGLVELQITCPKQAFAASGLVAFSLLQLPRHAEERRVCRDIDGRACAVAGHSGMRRTHG